MPFILPINFLFCSANDRDDMQRPGHFDAQRFARFAKTTLMNTPLLWSVPFILVTISFKKQVVSDDGPHITNPTSYVLTRITW